MYDQLGHQQFQNVDASGGGGAGGFGGGFPGGGNPFGAGNPFGGRGGFGGGGSYDDVFQNMAREFFGGGMGSGGGMFSSLQVRALFHIVAKVAA